LNSSFATLTRAYDHTQSSDYIMELTKSDYTGFNRGHTEEELTHA